MKKNVASINCTYDFHENHASEFQISEMNILKLYENSIIEGPPSHNIFKEVLKTTSLCKIKYHVR